MEKKLDTVKALFKGRKLVIATKHKKEEAIAPLLEKMLGVKCFVPKNMDTDTLGTFTGEVARTDNPLAVARKKCEIAMALTNCDLAVSSEGSFGTHPVLFFAQANNELLILIDKKNNLEISASALSAETNFDASKIKSEKELIAFANKIKFPSHGLIIRKEKESKEGIYKDITCWKSLKEVFKKVISKYGEAYVETDMRAMNNPSRMLVIKAASKKLITKIQACCPQCNTLGFGITETKKGLPCQICNFSTRSILSYIYTCKKCLFTKEEKYPNNKKVEDPMYCDICNP